MLRCLDACPHEQCSPPLQACYHNLMTNYAAFLRGIGPGNPNMRNDKLCGVLEGLGFTNVQSVISSGNVLFSSPETDTAALEARLEAAWPEQLGFASTTIIRSQAQLEEIVAARPFGDRVHGPSSYLLVTFFKQPAHIPFDLPYQPPGKPYQLLGTTPAKDALFTVTDNTTIPTTDLMTWLERQFTKQITSRTLLTITRIVKKLQTF